MMSSDFDGQEPSIDLEEVERRGEPRGHVRELSVEVPGLGSCAVLEASRKGFFVACEHPDSLTLEQIVEISVRGHGHDLCCKAEIVRKETHPRRGVALRISYIAPVEAETLKAMLG